MAEVPFFDLIIMIKNTAPHDIEKHIGKVPRIPAVVGTQLHPVSSSIEGKQSPRSGCYILIDELV